MIYHIYLLISIILTIAGQLMLKRGMCRYEHFRAADFPKLIKNRSVILGLTSYGASLVMWILALSNLELSYAYSLVSLNYFFIALASKIFFKEKISKKRWLSILTIILGVIIVSLS